MVLMVLDHTRDYFGNAAIDPTDLSRVSPALFLTRWVTHFCAPVFAFLAGTGAYLAGSRGRSRGDLAAFLATRGLWLIFLELTVVRLGLFFDPVSAPVILTVLWSIGASFLVLAGLVFLPSRVVGALGVLLIATHGLAGGFLPGSETPAALRAAGALLLRPGFLPLPGGVNVLVGYPLLPWLGVVAAGYGFGEVIRLEPGRRRRVMWITGVAMTAAFVILRAWGVYGEPRPWATQATPLLDRALVHQLHEATTFAALRADDARPGDRGPGGDRPRGHPRPGRPRPRDARPRPAVLLPLAVVRHPRARRARGPGAGIARRLAVLRRRLWAPLPRAGR